MSHFETCVTNQQASFDILLTWTTLKILQHTYRQSNNVATLYRLCFCDHLSSKRTGYICSKRGLLPACFHASFVWWCPWASNGRRSYWCLNLRSDRTTNQSFLGNEMRKTLHFILTYITAKLYWGIWVEINNRVQLTFSSNKRSRIVYK